MAPSHDPVPLPPDTPTLIDLARSSGIISPEQAQLLIELAAATPVVPSTGAETMIEGAPPAPVAPPGVTPFEGITRSGVHRIQAADTIDERAGAGAPARSRHPSEVVRAGTVFFTHADFNLAEMTDVPEEARAAWLLPGNRFGKYVLVTRIGAGAMGDVWRAWQIDLPRWVALKFLKGDNPEEVARFVQEARTAAKLTHHNIVTTFEAGEVDGRRFIAMEYLEGADLSRGALAVRPALEALRDAARAVHYAHEQGIVHRDLKPSNLVLTRTGRLCVTDFGLAKSLRTPSGLSQTGALVGTPYYMSPEQAGGKTDLDGRSDVFALGATLYHLLVGRPPFTGSTWVEILRGVLQDEPIPPRRLNPSLSREVETIVLKCLEKEPARRYETALALHQDIDRFLRGEPIQARPASFAYKIWLRLRRHKAVSAAVAVLLGTLSAFGTAWWFTPGTLHVHAGPPGARVEVAGRRWTADADPHPVSLDAGVYELTVALPDHEPETRTVAVERGRSKDLTLRLAHHQGRVEAESQPGGSEILVDEIAYGSRVRNLPLDTGRHRLRAWSLGHYTREMEVEVRKAETARAFLWLEPAVAWTYTSTGISAGPSGNVDTVDLDGDGVRELLHLDSTALVFRRPQDGVELRRIPAADSLAYNYFLFDLGEEVGRVVLIGGERTSGAWAVCVDPRREGEEAFVWRWEGPAQEWSHPTGMAILPLPDLTGDGVAELALSMRPATIAVLDGRTGREWGMRTLPVYPGGFGLLDARDADRLLFTGPKLTPERSLGGPDLEHSAGCVRLSDGALEWTVEVGKTGHLTLTDLERDGVREVRFLTANAVHVLEGRTGAQRWTAPIPGQDARDCGLTDLDGDGVLDSVFLGREGRAYALSGKDGGALWDRALDALDVTQGRGGIARLSGGELVFRRERGLLAVDARDGTPRWTIEGEFTCVERFDVDGDGADELLVGERGVGLVCLGEDGRRRWTLPLAQDVTPVAVAADVDGDGQGELVLHSAAASIGVVRPPRMLWSRTAAGPLQAAPRAIDLDGDGSLEVVQLGAWGQDRHLACLDGRSGRIRWLREEVAAPNRGPGVADLDGDGIQDVVLVGGRRRGTGGARMFVFRGSDGEPVRDWEYDGSDLYSMPGIADANGDGTPEVVHQRWSGQDLACVDGRSGKMLWRHVAGAPSMGGVAAADLDGDGKADFVAPFLDGRVYAVRGTDGSLLWSASIDPEGSRAPATVEDADGDGAPEVFVVSRRGTLWALSGKDGSVRWTLPGGSEGLGRPALARRAGAPALVVAAQGTAGLIAADAATGAGLWHGPVGRVVLAAPLVRDLDRDGKPEVIGVDWDGELFVLDLADGRTLWQLKIGEGPAEADPEVADLDGDGVLDILVALHDGTLSAVSGRGTIGARRRR